MRFAAATKKSLSDSWIFRLRGAAASQKQSNPIKSEKKNPEKNGQIKTVEAELLCTTKNIVYVKAAAKKKQKYTNNNFQHTRL